VLSDEEFGERLAAQMRFEVADIQPDPGWPAALRRRHARHVVTMRAAVVGPALAVVVATALVAAGGTGRGAAPPAAGPATTNDLHDAAYVTAHTTAALDSISGYVERTTSVLPGGVTDVLLTDPTTGQFRFDSSAKDGSPLNTIGGSGALTDRPTVTVVDHPDRAWWTYRVELPSDAPSGAKANASAQTAVGPFEDPVDIRSAITAGQLQVLGTQLIDGQQTLQLRVTSAPKELPGTMDLWVDSQSYLPVRLSVNKTGTPVTQDYTWLARTPDNLAALTVIPPASFTHLDKPIDHPTGGAAG
jgi:hypothetical protein